MQHYDDQQPRTFPLDAEHIGVRIVVPFLALFACIGSYWLSAQLVPAGSIETVGAVVVAAVAALSTAWLAERYLKRYWPSGRTLTLEANTLTLRERDGRTVSLRWEGYIHVLAWRFTIPPRRGRVPKGWYCMACRLLQDEEDMIVYTFMPPDRAEDLPTFPAFTYLLPAKKQEKKDWLKAGEQGRLYAAERERWVNGAEMTPKDFASLVETMARRVADWPAERAAHAAEPPAKPGERPPAKGDDTPITLR